MFNTVAGIYFCGPCHTRVHTHTHSALITYTYCECRRSTFIRVLLLFPMCIQDLGAFTIIFDLNSLLLVGTAVPMFFPPRSPARDIFVRFTIACCTASECILHCLCSLLCEAIRPRVSWTGCLVLELPFFLELAVFACCEAGSTVQLYNSCYAMGS